MTEFRAVQGDIKDYLIVQLAGIEDGSTIASVVSHVWADGITPVELTAEVDDADYVGGPTIRVELGSDAEGWLVALALTPWQERTFKFEHEATFLDGSVLTWPREGTDTLVVRAHGDPPAA